MRYLEEAKAQVALRSPRAWERGGGECAVGIERPLGVMKKFLELAVVKCA